MTKRETTAPRSARVAREKPNRPIRLQLSPRRAPRLYRVMPSAAKVTGVAATYPTPVTLPPDCLSTSAFQYPRPNALLPPQASVVRPRDHRHRGDRCVRQLQQQIIRQEGSDVVDASDGD